MSLFQKIEPEPEYYSLGNTFLPKSIQDCPGYKSNGVTDHCAHCGNALFVHVEAEAAMERAQKRCQELIQADGWKSECLNRKFDGNQ